MSGYMMRSINRPARVVLCGRSLCSKALGEYLRGVASREDAPLDIVFESCAVDDAAPIRDADVVIVCASECSGQDDPAVFEAAQAQYPSARIIAISPRAHAWNLVTALDSGAKGFIACGLDDITDVVSALVVVLEDEIAFSSAVSRLIVTTLRRSGVGSRATAPGMSAEGLTDRERGVLALLCEGLSNQQIAQALGLSPNTIKNHLARVYRKLGVDSRSEAISVAMRAGVL